MKISLYKMLLGCVAVFGLAAAGCDEVTMSDVESARENVKEEAEDVQEAENEAREEIAEEQGDVDELVRDGNEEIAEERKDLAEAQSEAEKVEREFVNQQQRRAYIEQHRTALNDIDAQLDDLEENTGDLENDAARDARDSQLEGVRTLYDDANDMFGDLDATDDDNWKNEQSAFAAAFQRLEQAMNNLGTTATNAVDPAGLPAPAPIEPSVP